MTLGGTELAALGGTMLAVSLVPGASDAAVVARAVSQGLAAALAVVAGIVAADGVFICVAASGLHLAAAWLDDALIWLRWPAAAYLLWLAWGLWRAPAAPRAPAAAASTGSGFAGGFLITLADPRAILFYAALLPGLLDPQRAGWDDYAAVLLTATLVIAAVKLGAAALARTLASGVRRPATARVLRILAALALLATAIWLLAGLR